MSDNRVDGRLYLDNLADDMQLHHTKEDVVMPLTMAPMGETLEIIKVGGNPKTKKHLENIGFVPGGLVSVISAIEGNLIVNVKETRVAVSKEMALKITVGA